MTTSDAELVEAVDVWRDALNAWQDNPPSLANPDAPDLAAAAVIQADRKAVRDAAVGEIVALRSACAALLAAVDEPTPMPTGQVNLSDFARTSAMGMGRILMEHLPSIRAAIASGEHEGAGE